MKRFLLPLIPLAATLFVAGCATVGSESSSAILAQVDNIATGAYSTRPVVVELDGKPAILFSTKGDRVALQIGDKRQLLDETARVHKGGGYFALHKQEKNISALWWSHEDGKNLYFTSSSDAGQRFVPVSMVNSDHGVLPPYNLSQGSQGALGVTYHDERLPGYEFFFSRSVDGGKTWATPDQRLDTPPADGRSSSVADPQTVVSGSAWVSIWSDAVQVSGQASYRIVSRRSLDAGITWSPAEVIYSSAHQLSTLQLRSRGNNLVVAADDLNNGIVALASSDEGKTWRSAGILAGTEHLTNSGIDIAISADRAHIVWLVDQAEKKALVMRASLDIATQKWLEPAKRLDIKAFDNTKSTWVSILATTQGPVIAAWLDYRDIRPGIYLSASYDKGQTWSAPQPLVQPGELSVGWPKLIPWGAQAAITYEVYPTDVATSGKFVVRSLAFGEDMKGLSGLPEAKAISEADRKAKLESRVKALWDARVAGSYDKVYEIFDFAYRAAWPKKHYVDNSGVITYLSYTLDKVSITGNEADVNIKTKYEVKPTMLPSTGMTLKVDATESDSPAKWVWVANDWYLVYAPAYDQSILKY